MQILMISASNRKSCVSKKGIVGELRGRQSDSLEAGLGRSACWASHRRFLCEECDPFCIHTSIESSKALRMRMIQSVWEGGRARACDLHIVLKPVCMRSCDSVCCRVRPIALRTGWKRDSKSPHSCGEWGQTLLGDIKLLSWDRLQNYIVVL